MGPMNANDGTKEHDKSTDEAENSFDDNSKIDGDLTNLLNQIKEGNQLSDPFSPTNQDKEKDKGNEVFPDMSKKGNFLKTLYEKIWFQIFISSHFILVFESERLWIEKINIVHNWQFLFPSILGLVS